MDSSATRVPPRKTIWTLLGVWFVTYAWRPFLLGFYSDDYALILQPVALDLSAKQLLDFYSRMYANRPISGLLAYHYLQLFADSAVLWHLAGAATCLLTGALLWLVLERLNRIGQPLDGDRLTWLTAIWWLLPTSFGFVSWPTYVIHFPVVPLFLLSFFLLISNPRLPWPATALALLVHGLGLATHEAFYFQYLVPFAVLLLVRQDTRWRWRNWGGWLSAFTLAQGLAIVFNRLTRGGPKKQFDPEFILNRIVSVVEHPRFLVHAVIPLLIVSVAAFLLLQTVRRWRRHSRQIPANHALTVIFVGGLLLSVFLYLGAGYSIRPFGLGSRTTICVSVIAVLLLLPLLKQNPGFARATKAASWGVLLLLAVLSGIQGYHWHGSWRLQNEVMSRLPQRQLLEVERGALILCLVPNYDGHVVVFEDVWTLDPAASVHYPELRPSRLRFLPHKNTGFRAAEASFVGGRLSYRHLYAGHQLGTYKARHLYVWNYYTGELLRAAGDVVIPPHQNLPSFHAESLIAVD